MRRTLSAVAAIAVLFTALVITGAAAGGAMAAEPDRYTASEGDHAPMALTREQWINRALNLTNGLTRAELNQIADCCPQIQDQIPVFARHTVVDEGSLPPPVSVPAGHEPAHRMRQCWVSWRSTYENLRHDDLFTLKMAQKWQYDGDPLRSDHNGRVYANWDPFIDPKVFGPGWMWQWDGDVTPSPTDWYEDLNIGDDGQGKEIHTSRRWGRFVGNLFSFGSNPSVRKNTLVKGMFGDYLFNNYAGAPGCDPHDP